MVGSAHPTRASARGGKASLLSIELPLKPTDGRPWAVQFRNIPSYRPRPWLVPTHAQKRLQRRPLHVPRGADVLPLAAGREEPAQARREEGRREAGGRGRSEEERGAEEER